MAGRYTFHNKFHRSNHHTVSGLDTVDSGFDPIASRGAPFIGTFYNLITDSERTFTIETNSLEWHNAYTTNQEYSATWMLTRTLYTTVSSLSDNWNDGYEAYTHFNTVSNLFVSLYTTVCSYSAEWGSPYLMFTNRVQEYTHAKTFSGQDLQPLGSQAPAVSTFDWNLDIQQVAFITLTNRNITLRNPLPDSQVQGGLYTLVVKQPQENVVPYLTYDVFFDTQYRFNDRDVRSDIILKAYKGITVINFICINGLMYGDVIYLSGHDF
jgi:hypothetical protein